MNPNWYYRCDLRTKITDAYTQIPEVWENVSGMADLDDVTLADMSWSGNPDVGFLTEEAATELGIRGMDKVKAIANTVKLQQVRQLRDAYLYQSDVLVLADRWAFYTPERQKEIADYRQALRDITTQTDADNIVWPKIVS